MLENIFAEVLCLVCLISFAMSQLEKKQNTLMKISGIKLESHEYCGIQGEEISLQVLMYSSWGNMSGEK